MTPDQAPAAAGGADPGDGSASAVAAQLVAGLLDEPARLGRVRLVTVDGPAGSGKTTTAARLVAAAAEAGRSAAVVHMDDLYAGWDGFEPTLWPRVRTQVLDPLRRGRAGRFQRYDWGLARFDGWVDVPPVDVLVLEGCGSCPRAVDPLTSLRLWVEAPPAVRLARGLARDGAAAEPHWRTWMRDEQAYFAAQGTRGRCDVVLDAFGMMAG